MKKVLIVGGVAGGASAAARLRRLDENIEVTLFEKGEYISFANCGLPYYISGEIEKRESLLVQTPQAMKKRFNIDVRVKNEVVEIDEKNKSIKVKNIETNEVYDENYDYLVLSPGAKPVRPNIKGIDSKNIFTVRNIPDIDKIKNYVKENNSKRVAIVGGGYIGIEMAENMSKLGLEVSIIEAQNQIMGQLDYDMSKLVQEYINSKKINICLNTKVKEFIIYNNMTEIICDVENTQKKITADFVILAIGVKPDIEFVKNTSIKIGDKGGIIVDEYLKTSVESIYAIGDAIEVDDFVNEEKTIIPLAGPANKQGRIVADNIVAKIYSKDDMNVQYKGTQGTSIIKIFDLTVASTGNNTKLLEKNNIKYLSSITISSSHAIYYPGAKLMTIKLIYNSEGKILGSQIVGYEGVDKRIDVISTVLRLNGTIFDLQELELAYAPPYSSAKDPVNMAAYVAGNVIKKEMDVIHWDEIEKLNLDETILLDVREPFELKRGYIQDSVNIPLDNLRNELQTLSKDKNIVIYCQIGLRGYLASKILKQNGFNNVKNLTGGYKFYNQVISSTP